MTVHALLFEAESIQAYITDSGRLTDAVGASARIDQLCGDLVDAAATDLLSAVLTAAGVNGGEVRFSRRGGGAFIALFDRAEARDRVQALWSAALVEVAPGLRFGLAATTGDDALSAAQDGMKRLRALRNLQVPVLPEAGPLTRRTPRTGRAAVRQVSKGDSDEWVDAQTAIHSGYQNRDETHDSLTKRFSNDLRHWPRNLEEDFPFLPNGHHEIAMIHADGNGLGVALQALAEQCKADASIYIEAYAGFSRAVTVATCAAAEEATQLVLQPATAKNDCVPARPLVLGGDDLTVLIRPDLAVPFAEAFLKAFEKQTEAALAPLRQRFKFLPERLSAAAGIAIVHAGHPFDRAMHLAEALCKAVKAETKSLVPAGQPAPSGLMFYRQTVSLLDDWAEVRAAETTPEQGGVRYVTVHGPYLVMPDAQRRLPSLADLRALRDVLEREVVARGPLRQLITQLHQTPETALKSWNRVWEMLDQRDPAARSALAAALQGFNVPGEPGKLPCAPRGDKTDVLHTPLGDALTLGYLERPVPADSTQKTMGAAR